MAALLKITFDAVSRDILDVPVERPEINETTALGAAYLAGIAVGFWKDRSEIINQWNLDKRFEPKLEEEKRNELYTGWQKAVKAAMAFK